MLDCESPPCFPRWHANKSWIVLYQFLCIIAGPFSALLKLIQVRLSSKAMRDDLECDYYSITT